MKKEKKETAKKTDKRGKKKIYNQELCKMQVELVNDGPVTIIIDTKEKE